MVGSADRQRFAACGGVCLVALWFFATGFQRPESVPPPDTLANETEHTVFPEGFAVSATPQTAAFVRERGAAFGQADSKIRFMLRVGDEAECLESLKRGTTLAIVLPRLLDSNETWELARRDVSVSVTPLFYTEKSMGQRPSSSQSPEGGQVFYLYSRTDTLQGRARLRAFTGICRQPGQQEISHRLWNGPV